MKIEIKTLIDKNACEQQVELFRQLFGESVEATQSLCQKYATMFDWGWAAKNLLPSLLYADYEAKRAPLYADYRAKLALLFCDLFIAAHRGEEQK